MSTTALTVIGQSVSITSGAPGTLMEVTFTANMRWYRIITGNDRVNLLEAGGPDGGGVSAVVGQTLEPNEEHIRQVPGVQARKRNLDSTTRKIWIGNTFACTITPFDSDYP